MDERSKEQFKEEARAYLSGKSLEKLRAYGRFIKHPEPTKLKKDSLIEEILRIEVGEFIPERSKRGAPIKNDQLDKEIVETMHTLKARNFPEMRPINLRELREELTGEKFDGDHLLTFSSDDAQEISDWQKKVQKQMVRGQLAKLDEVYMLISHDCKEDGKQVLVSDEQVKQYDLRLGDTVSVSATMSTQMLVAQEILAINDLVPSSISRGNFDDEEVEYPSRRIQFLENAATDKYFSWLLPVYRGQRGAIVGLPKAGKTSLVYDMALSVKKADQNVAVYVLLNAQSPETVWKFRKALPKECLLYSSYEDSAEKQVFVANFMLDRVKRQVELGQDVVLFVDSLSELARAYNETEQSSGGKMLACGLESWTVQYIRKYFGAARCLKKGGSLTIVGTISENTGNPADDFLARELCSLANLEVRLDGDLARRRVFPAIDFAHSHTQSIDENVENTLLKITPENVLGALEKASSKEEFFAKIE